MALMGHITDLAITDIMDPITMGRRITLPDLMPTTAGIITTATVTGTIGEIESPEHHFRAFSRAADYPGSKSTSHQKLF
jgi:hypothetical protein